MIPLHNINAKSFLNHEFFSPEPDNSLHCKNMDTGLVYCTVCLFNPH